MSALPTPMRNVPPVALDRFSCSHSACSLPTDDLIVGAPRAKTCVVVATIVNDASNIRETTRVMQVLLHLYIWVGLFGSLSSTFSSPGSVWYCGEEGMAIRLATGNRDMEQETTKCWWSQSLWERFRKAKEISTWCQALRDLVTSGTEKNPPNELMEKQRAYFILQGFLGRLRGQLVIISWEA
jgi:hypothetical protein